MGRIIWLPVLQASWPRPEEGRQHSWTAGKPCADTASESRNMGQRHQWHREVRTSRSVWKERVGRSFLQTLGIRRFAGEREWEKPRWFHLQMPLIYHHPALYQAQSMMLIHWKLLFKKSTVSVSLFKIWFAIKPGSIMTITMRVFTHWADISQRDVFTPPATPLREISKQCPCLESPNTCSPKCWCQDIEYWVPFPFSGHATLRSKAMH